MTATPRPPHVLVTGAAGFVGQALVERHLLPRSREGALTLTLTDRQPCAARAAGVRWIAGDIADPTLQSQLFESPVDRVFHLAAVVSGEAERDYALGLRVNLHATLALLERCRAQHAGATAGATAGGAAPVRFVFASSIAVWGSGLPRRVDDRYPVRPRLSYGTHKRMVELALHDLTRRGELDGRALRLSGVVARPRASGAALSSFNSDLLREPLQGREVTCPVGADGCIWLARRTTTADQLWALGELDAPRWHSACAAHGSDGAVNAPTWPVRIEALLAALGEIDPAAPSRIRFAPDAALQAQFGHWPVEVDFALARDLGLTDDRARHGERLADFVRGALADAACVEVAPEAGAAADTIPHERALRP